jgi:hypothetical protein
MFQMRAILCFSLAWIVPVVTTSGDPVEVKKAKPYAEKTKSATTQAAEKVKGATPH